MLSVAVMCFMCTKPKPKVSIDLERVRDSVEEHTGKHKFSPLITKDRHLAVEYRIENGKIITDVDSSPVKIVFGKMPRMKSMGTFQVVLLDKQDSVLLSYYMTNPLYIRVESGPGRGVKRIQNGSFFVRLPKDQSIGKIVFIEEKEGRIESNVSGKFSHIQ